MIKILTPRNRQCDRLEYIEQFEAKFRTFPPRPRSTVARHDGHWLHLCWFKSVRSKPEDVERSRIEYEAEKRDKETYSAFRPFSV